MRKFLYKILSLSLISSFALCNTPVNLCAASYIDQIESANKKMAEYLENGPHYTFTEDELEQIEVLIHKRTEYWVERGISKIITSIDRLTTGEVRIRFFLEYSNSFAETEEICFATNV